MSDQYVSTLGSDTTGNGSETNPWATIQKGIDSTVSGDTVWVKADGTYTITAQINVDAANNITIKGYYSSLGDQDYGGSYYKNPSNGWAIVDANSGSFNAFDIPAYNMITMENIKIVNVSTSYFGIIQSTITAAGHLFRNIWLTGGKSGIQSLAAGAVYDDCVFTGSYYVIPKGAPAYGALNFDINSNVGYQLVKDCYFELDNGDCAILVYGHTGAIIANCIVCLKGSHYNAFMLKGYGCAVNNTIYCSGSCIAGIGNYDVNTSFCALNNIIIGCTTPIVTASGSLGAIDYNCYTGNNEAHGINSADPKFKDAVNGDFRLLPGSPCLNTGKQVIGGDDKIYNGFSSIGAWQRKAEIISKAKYVNFGRMAIIR